MDICFLHFVFDGKYFGTFIKDIFQMFNILILIYLFNYEINIFKQKVFVGTLHFRF